jgi:SlyX protein
MEAEAFGMEQRLIELEIKYSYQQDLLTQLNEVIIEQGRQISDLQKEIVVLRRHLEAGGQSETDSDSE